MVQDGARRHYVVPVALERAGMLDRVFVEWYTSGWSVESLIATVAGFINPPAGRKLRARRHAQLPPGRVFHHPWLIVAQLAKRKRFNSAEAYYAWVSQQVGRWILRKGFGHADCLYGYIRNVAPAVLQACRQRGIKTIGDQMIAPAVVEIAEAKIQSERWPGWQTAEQRIDEAVLIDCEARSWEACDHITCGSDYVVRGLAAQGIQPEQITVIPYAPSGANLPFINRHGRSGPMTVGFLGSVNLRKGAPYFLEVARRFDPAQVRFVMVGPVALDRTILAARKGPAQIVGAVPRSDIAQWLSQFDLLLFPSTCEGCAGSVLEAMETGLPVLATPNSGAVIRDGIDGYLRAYDDIDGFERAIRMLHAEPEKRHAIGQAARATVETLNMEWYAEQLSSMILAICK